MGSNVDLPSIEVYPGKRVCVMTGAHVPGTPTEVQNWNEDVLDALLEANDAVATSQREDPSRDDVSTGQKRSVKQGHRQERQKMLSDIGFE